MGRVTISSWSQSHFLWELPILGIFLVLSWACVAALERGRPLLLVAFLPALLAVLNIFTQYRIAPIFCLLFPMCLLVALGCVKLWENSVVAWFVASVITAPVAAWAFAGGWKGAPAAYLLSSVAALSILNQLAKAEVEPAKLFRWISPVHGVFDLLEPLLRRIDGPGPSFE